MIKLENYEVVGWEHAIRGMRNPMNSWEKSDSEKHLCPVDDCEKCFQPVECGIAEKCDGLHIGNNDYDLMVRLRNAGTDHRKYMRMITIYVDITAPLYWWKEADTYKVGTVANSCSTMHKIHAKEFTLDDFSHEHLDGFAYGVDLEEGITTNSEASHVLMLVIKVLNNYRKDFIKTKDKRYFDNMIQLLPSSYNQKRTVMLNYEVLANMYKSRKNHKLDEWHDFCDWIKELPYSELITGEFEEE